MSSERPTSDDQDSETAIPSDSNRSIPIVGMGASAGGLSAFKEFLQETPPDTGVAFVLVQHLDPTHESLMVDLLSRQTQMTVEQIENGTGIRPNHVYVIPPNWDLSIRSGVFQLVRPQQRRGMRMPIDFFFNSLAEEQREKGICIILSGTGSDGTLGLKTVKSFGGMVMVQLPEEAQYDGMPSSAIATGVVDYILPTREMASALLNYTRHSYVRGHPAPAQEEGDEGSEVHAILGVIHGQLGHNLYHYKKNMLIRRIQRRMGLMQLERMREYLSVLRAQPDETKELLQDCLIGVTGFFREPEGWQALDELVLERLLQSKTSQDSIRVWVPGCSSGEEAYTVAILLHERLERLRTRVRFHIFATDIDTNALAVARTGRYPESIAASVAESHLDRYCTKDDGFYQVTNKLRENIVFSAQNLISDPPFSKLDIITCRNLLIYLEAEIQRNVISLFHFGLDQGGHLMLGSSETIGSAGPLFEAVSKKWRIYRRLESSIVLRSTLPSLREHRPWARGQVPRFDRPRPAARPGDVIRDVLLDKFAPTSLLITSNHEVLYHHGDTGSYLKLPSGDQTSDLFSLVREGLAGRIRGAVHKALRAEAPVVVRGARVKRDAGYASVGFDVTPLSGDEGTEGLYVISLWDEESADRKPAEVESSPDDESMMKQLEIELSATRQELQTTIEEFETSSEELKAANEEVMSMNEELQSSNEELETSKEELQSLNEELNTVNTELQEKVRNLEETNNDVMNLVTGTHIAALFLDTELTIRFYTPPAKGLFNLIATDVGRPLRHVTRRFEDPRLMSDLSEVLDSLKLASAYITTDEGEWYTRKIFPYRTQDRRIEGVVLTFEDITELMQKRDALRKQNQVMADAQSIALFGSWELNPATGDLEGSDELLRIFGISRSGFGGTFDDMLAYVHADDRARLKAGYWTAVEAREVLNIEFRTTGREAARWVHLIARTEYDEARKPVRSVGMTQDITERRRVEAELRLLYESLEATPQGFDIVDEDGLFTYVNGAYLQMWGYGSRAEVVGTSRVLHCADPDMPQRIIATVNEHGPSDFEFLARRKDGSVFDVRVRVSLHTDAEGRRRYHGFSEDVMSPQSGGSRRGR